VLGEIRKGVSDAGQEWGLAWFTTTGRRSGMRAVKFCAENYELGGLTDRRGQQDRLMLDTTHYLVPG
jgi:hypothetical protein